MSDEQPDELVPAARFDWERVVRRSTNLPWPTRSVGLLMATFADVDGSRVHPGFERLMTITGYSKRAILRHMKELRDSGLLVIAKRGYRQGGIADEYQLTAPISVFLTGDTAGVVDAEAPLNVSLVAPMHSVPRPVTESSKVPPGGVKGATGGRSKVPPMAPHQTTYQPLPNQSGFDLDSRPRATARATGSDLRPGDAAYTPTNPYWAQAREARNTQ